MEALLGGKYRVGGQLTWDEKLLPRGVWGNNDLASIMKAQGITGPQPWPKSRPPEIDDEAMEAFNRAIEDLRREDRERVRHEHEGHERSQQR
jgi:hypothetical protein